MKKLYQEFCHFIIPRRCSWCRRRVAPGCLICQDCHPFLPRLAEGCYRCGLPVGCAVSACADCLRQPPSFTRTIVPFAYEYPVTDWIVQLKFSGRLNLANLLGLALVAEIKGAYQHDVYPTHIIPVPLHPQRIRSRGFNQASEIAKVLTKHLPSIIMTDPCRRQVATPAQSRLTKHARMNNLIEAFTVVTKPLPAHIALVDDVMTTGQTLRALAQQCQLAGAQRIDVWCVARTLRNG